MQEEKADPARKKRDGEDGVGGALGGAESDGEGVVVVVDELEGTGEAGAHFAESGARLGSDLRSEPVEESIQLGGGRLFRPRFRGGHSTGGCGFRGLRTRAHGSPGPAGMPGCGGGDLISNSLGGSVLRSQRTK